MEEFLIKLRILQVYKNGYGRVKKGRGFMEAYRLNPYNPLTYLALALAIPAAFIKNGYMAYKNFSNPFKWN